MIRKYEIKNIQPIHDMKHLIPLLKNVEDPCLENVATPYVAIRQGITDFIEDLLSGNLNPVRALC